MDREAMIPNLSRPVLMHIDTNGTVTYRQRLEPLFSIAALPFCSVYYVEEAQALQTLLCQVQGTSHPRLPGQRWYRYASFGGQIDDIPVVGRVFEKAYHDLRATTNNVILHKRGAA